MPNWRKKTRAQHKARLRAWYDSDSENKHESKYVQRRVRRGLWSREFLGRSKWEAWWSPIWRSKYDLRQKHNTRRFKEGLKAFTEFPYYEDCRYHVCKVTELQPHEETHTIDIEGESLLNGTHSSCSYEHCGILHLTKEEGEERAKFALEMGMMPYQIKHVYEIPKDPEKLKLVLRSMLNIEETWNFNKNGGTELITETGKHWLWAATGINYDDLTPMDEEEMGRLEISVSD